MPAQDYRARLMALVGDQGVMNFSAESVTEAKQILYQIKQMQVEIKIIKRDLDMDMRQIRADYQQRIATAGSGTSAIFTLFGKRKLAGNARADAKRHLTMERDRALQEYVNVKFTADSMLNQIEKAKLQIQQFVEQNK